MDRDNSTTRFPTILTDRQQQLTRRGISYAVNRNGIQFTTRPVLTVKRKLLILRHRTDPRNQHQAERGMIGSAEWMQNLLEYMSMADRDISLLDVQRWCKNHAWITDHHQPPRGMAKYWPPPVIPPPYFNNEVVNPPPDQRQVEIMVQDRVGSLTDIPSSPTGSSLFVPPMITAVWAMQDPSTSSAPSASTTQVIPPPLIGPDQQHEQQGDQIQEQQEQDRERDQIQEQQEQDRERDQMQEQQEQDRERDQREEQQEEQEQRQEQTAPESSDCPSPNESRKLRDYHKVVKSLQRLTEAVEKVSNAKILKNVSHMYRVMERNRSKHVILVTHKTAFDHTVLVDEIPLTRRTKRERLTGWETDSIEIDVEGIDDSEMDDSEIVQQYEDQTKSEESQQGPHILQQVPIFTIDLSNEDDITED